MSKKIALLKGGYSSEREISLHSAKSCFEALRRLNFEVVEIDVNKNIDLIKELKKAAPNVVFNALHGTFGEDGTIQAILEYLELPYTHSGVLASSLAMDKARAKIIAKASGVQVAPSLVVNRFDMTNKHLLEPPYVIKPVNEGSSYGVFLVQENDEVPLKFLQSNKWQFSDLLMVEKYVPGRELSCAVLKDKALAVCEIFTNGHEFYNLSSKYNKGGSIHQCPAKISPKFYEDVQIMSLAAHKAMGCKTVSRSDFRLDEKTGTLCWLEINTQPGLTDVSLLPEMAMEQNIKFDELIKILVEDASCKR